jgi:type VI secretion system FHA domain protein
LPLALPKPFELAMPAPPLPDPLRLVGAEPPAAIVPLALPSAAPMAPPAPSMPAPAAAMVMPLPRSANTKPAQTASAKPAMPVAAIPSELPPELLADLTELPRVGPEATGSAIPVPPRRASRAPRPSGQVDISDLAFWRGLGIEPDSLSPEERAAALEAFGRAMRSAADGLVALLGARRFVKSEVDLEQTQLAAADNNAFKFSPSGEAALRRLMENETGFTPVDLAVSRAFDDLRAHELGIAAGMKAALGAMLERLAPASIERRFAPIRGGLFTSRKARLWDLYTTLHSEIADGAESRFKDAFSRSFATAYDQRAREASRPGDL